MWRGSIVHEQSMSVQMPKSHRCQNSRNVGVVLKRWRGEDEAVKRKRIENDVE